jgi:hypothetical protein
MGTGAYLRIERNGKWQNIEVEYLTPDEMMAMFIGRSDEELIRWMDILAARVMHYEQTLLYLKTEMKNLKEK